jgi:hypothetical protein
LRRREREQEALERNGKIRKVWKVTRDGWEETEDNRKILEETI